MLTDAGPLLTILDRRDPWHSACVELLATIHSPLQSTWPAVAEAMYLLGERGGWRYQEPLWRLLIRGDLVVLTTSDDAYPRARDLMHKYRDLPMDLADATLVVTAEENGADRVFTLDSNFRVYRLRGNRPFVILP